MRFGNGVRTRMDYDVTQGSYRLKDLFTYTGSEVDDSVPAGTACASGSVIQCLAYQYDKVSNITQMTDLVSRGGARTESVRDFGYDELDQLTHAEGPWGVQDYSYDEIGNITSKASVTPLTSLGVGWADRFARRAKALLPGTASTDVYQYSAARPQILTQVGAEAFGFDDWGNLSSRAAQSFAFDSINHMKSFTGASTYGYSYDESGDRVKKLGASGTTYFASKYFEKRGSEAIRYLFAGSKRIAQMASDGSLQYFHGDHLGSPNFMTNGAGAMSLHREYAPYGERVVETGAAASLSKVGFTDKYADDESGLTYFGARYYLAGVGRWTGADPVFVDILAKEMLLNPEAVQLWNYVKNCPLRLRDDLGTWTTSFGSLLSGTFLGGTAGGGLSVNVGHENGASSGSGWSFSVTGTVEAGVSGAEHGAGVYATSGSTTANSVSELTGTSTNYSLGITVGKNEVVVGTTVGSSYVGTTAALSLLPTSGWNSVPSASPSHTSGIGSTPIPFSATGSNTTAIIQWEQGKGFSFGESGNSSGAIGSALYDFIYSGGKDSSGGNSGPGMNPDSNSGANPTGQVLD